MTQAELAKHVGVWQPEISQWETGKRKPWDSQVQRLEEALGLPRGHLARAVGITNADQEDEAVRDTSDAQEPEFELLEAPVGQGVMTHPDTDHEDEAVRDTSDAQEPGIDSRETPIRQGASIDSDADEEDEVVDDTSDAEEHDFESRKAHVGQGVMTDPDTGEYVYKDMPLMPAIIGELAAFLFVGKTERRDAIAEAAVKYHADHGGAPSRSNTLFQAKKGLNTLEKQGRVFQTKGYGLWRFPKREPVDLSEPETIAETDSEDKELPYTIDIERQVGQGSQRVYVYSYPVHRELAELKGEDSWPIKIGRSGFFLQERVKEQIGTATPEWPVVHLAIHTDSAKNLEHMLHLWLIEDGRQVEGPGIEWFDASPNRVMSLLQHAFPGRFNDATEEPGEHI